MDFRIVGKAEEGIAVDDRQYDELIMELEFARAAVRSRVILGTVTG